MGGLCSIYLNFIFVFFFFFLFFLNAFVEVFSSLRQNRKTQLTLTCSRLTTETKEKGVKYVQSLQQKHLSIFHTFF